MCCFLKCWETGVKYTDMKQIKCSNVTRLAQFAVIFFAHQKGTFFYITDLFLRKIVLSETDKEHDIR